VADRQNARQSVAVLDGFMARLHRTTIDKSGRVVIPAGIRERAGLTPGAELEITEDETGVRLERVAAGPKLVKVGRRVVAQPTALRDACPSLDIATLVEAERNRWR
jgi:AbrB family looped-hinge helix DNA binding protein